MSQLRLEYSTNLITTAGTDIKNSKRNFLASEPGKRMESISFLFLPLIPASRQALVLMLHTLWLEARQAPKC